MQFSLISAFVLLAVVAIGTIDAAPSPIRYVTPRPGIDYRMRYVPPRRIPDNRLRYVRSINDDDLLLDADIPRRPVRSADDDDSLGAVNFVDEIHHAISKRSPERVVINYKPPPQNGPRYARSADLEEIEQFEE